MWGHNGEVAIYKLTREPSEEIRLSDSLIIDFYIPEEWANEFLSFKLSNLWYFVMASLENDYNTLLLQLIDSLAK